MRNSLWKDGTILWSDVVKKSPVNVRAYDNLGREYNNLGTVLFSKKNIQSALEMYNMAIAITPNLTPAYNNRGLIYDLQGKIDLAIDDYIHAIAIDSRNAEAYANRGMAYGKIKRYDAAIRDLKMAIQINPNNAYAYYNLGTASDLLGRHEQAIECFNMAISLGLNAYANRGLVLYKLDKTREAVSDFQKACTLGDNNGCLSLQEALKLTKSSTRK